MPTEGFRLQTRSGTNLALVDADLNTKVVTGDSPSGAALGFVPSPGGSVEVSSPSTDSNRRLRLGSPNLVDAEFFNYTAQNTGRYVYENTTMTAAWSASSGLTTNSGNITTDFTGVAISTYGFFPLGEADQIEVNLTAAFSDPTATNTLIDMGPFIRKAPPDYEPTDGFYFRLTSTGLYGVINFAAAETFTGVLPFTPTANEFNNYVIRCAQSVTRFFVDDTLLGEIPTPNGIRVFASSTLPFSVRHAIAGGAASVGSSLFLGNYDIQINGRFYNVQAENFGQRLYGPYQGLSGGTMGSLASYGNSTNPAAVLPTNSTSVITGMGGEATEDDTQAVDTDCLICSYQIPTSPVGYRARVLGITISSFVSSALTGGGYVAQWSLAFGHTDIDLATTETATTKEPRRIALGSQSVVANATSGTVLTKVSWKFTNIIYAEPGQFIAVVKKKVGTAPTVGSIRHLITIDYTWE